MITFSKTNRPAERSQFDGDRPFFSAPFQASERITISKGDIEQ
jgi:hypothetical protein